MNVPTYEEKLQAFNQLLALPNLSVEERYWIEHLKKLLEQGTFHDTWSRLRVQMPQLETIIFSAVMKVRSAAKTNL